jgi:hypothetical protein
MSPAASPTVGSTLSPGAKKEDQAMEPICDHSPAPFVPEGEYFTFCNSAQKYRNPRFKREEIALQLTLFDCKWAETN